MLSLHEAEQRGYSLYEVAIDDQDALEEVAAMRADFPDMRFIAAYDEDWQQYVVVGKPREEV